MSFHSSVVRTKTPSDSKSILPLFYQDGNVHLKTSLLYRSYITPLSALLSARQVPIRRLIYGA